MDYEKGFLVYEISNIIPEMHLPYDPTVREGNYTNREEVSYRDEDYHIAPVGETLPKALRTQVLTALTSNLGLVQNAW